MSPGAVVFVGIVVWLTLAVAVGVYGRELGFPFWPLFFAEVFLGPLGVGLVLLAVTVAGTRRQVWEPRPLPPSENDRLVALARDWPAGQRRF